MRHRGAFDVGEVPSLLHPRRIRVGVVVAQWNREITSALWAACENTLAQAGIKESNILVCWVPGSFELGAAAAQLLRQQDLNGVICLGCIIRGETPHFHYLSQAVAQGLMQLSVQTAKPVIFGVVTADTLTQARRRASAGSGNKGVEAAVSFLQMMAFQQQLTQSVIKGKSARRS